MMQRVLSNILRRVVRLRRREDGSATIEFVILYPIFMVLFLSGVESGVMMLRHAMLERGVDMSIRTLRLNTDSPPTFDELKSSVCNYAGLIKDCNEAVQIELVSVDTTNWTLAMDEIRCRDRDSDIDPVTETTYSPGASNQLMVMRVCAIVDPIFPGTGLGTIMPVDDSGGYALVTITAYVNEPGAS